MRPGNYKKEQRDEVFNNKLHEFAMMSGYDKFKQSKKVRFSDTSLCTNWFYKNQDRIFSIDNEDAKMITFQYEEMQDIKENERIALFEKRVKEFEQEKDLNKFNNSYRNIKFSDGTLMNPWFLRYKDILLNRSGEIYESIKSQYSKYKLIIGRSGATFEDRKAEFEKIDDLLKFYSKGNVKFSDGADTYTWFNLVGKTTLSLDDDVSKSIQKQHNAYLKLMENKKEQKYQLRLREFEQETSNDKFKATKYECTFKDGIVMGGWFARYKERILSDTDGVSLSIQNQYELYKKKYGKVFKTLEDRLQEFEQEQCLDKFKQTYCNVYFEDGTNMGSWFSRVDDDIRAMKDNELCISILNQHEIYLNLPENKKAKITRENNIRKKLEKM